MAKQDDVLKAILSVGDSKPTKTIHMKRFGVNFELQGIGGKEITKIREQATFTVKKGKESVKELDGELFNSLVIEKGCLVPKWNAKELLDKYGDSNAAIQSLLLAGEIAKVSAEIMDLSGFGDDAEEEEIKN
jgi:hypothetical protein